MLLATGLIAVAVSSLGTAWALRHARRHGLIDMPDVRRSHRMATPRGGGIGIVLACLGCFVVMAVQDGGNSRWWLVAGGLTLVAGIGWLDDHRPLPALPRLAVHVLSALLVALALHFGGAGELACLAGFVLVLGLVNAWNFMDGINGLAASQAMLCGVAFALLPAFPAQMLGIALAGACVGFLPFNFPRARLFLGDVGSTSLGYMVAVLISIGVSAGPARESLLLLLPPLAMLADSGLTLVWRMRRGDRWWQAHAEHAFQRWSRSKGQTIVTLAYGLWTTIVIGVMLLSRGHTGMTAFIAFLCCLTATALVWWWLHRKYASQSEGFGS
ncbi:MAG: hypothetical protein ABIO84_04275 [Lysobacter sp.]